jgi:cholesterol transport system auxiliary component
MNRAAGALGAVLAAGLTLSLAACTGSLFKSKAAPPTVYLLSAPAPAPAPAPAAAAPAAGAPAGGGPSGEIPVDLAVLRPKLRPGLESDRIAVLYPDRRLDYFADARWSGPLGEVLQYFAVQEFHSRAHLRTVSGDASVFASAYWLEIEVTDFQAEYTSATSAPTVHARFLARIGSSGDRRILGQFTADAQQPAADNRLTAIVDAYARAADAALSKIVADADATLASQKFDSPAASSIR